ncbi:MAG: peptidylprolyl isomerase [Verrucomicrobiales bacterium]|nr:peptidylprolyl isomerase [Verrucomicrobiales bacterium]
MNRLLTTSSFALLLLGAPGHNHAANAPTNLRVTTPFLRDNTVEFAWQDNSDDEDSFEIEIRTEEDGEPVLTLTTVPNQTLNNDVQGGGSGTVLFVRARATSEASGDSAWTETLSVTYPTTSLAILSRQFVSGTVGTPITPFKPETFGEATITGYTASDLPPGLEFDTTDGTISGTPAEAGVFLPSVSATDDTSTASTFVRFGIEKPLPQLALTTALPDTALNLGTPPAALDLAQHLTYGEITAFQMVTNYGPLDLIIFADAAPLTLANLRSYLGRNAYDGVVFHRSVNSATAGIDIIQAGWFKPDPTGSFTTVTSDPNIPNEPAFPNDRGTIAMAKLGGDAHSASSQFYFNVSDSPALDSSSNNGGFSVFGRLTPSSLAVMDAIHALPTASYSITLDDSPRSMVDWPTNTVLEAEATPGSDDVVQILSLTELDSFVSYAVTAQSSTAVAATIDGTSLNLVPRHPGSSTLTITATDLDGNTLDTTITATVTHTVATSTAIVTVAGATHPAITFPHLTTPGAPVYEVQKSADLKTWTTVWQTSDTFTHELVATSTPDGDTTTLTVRTPAPYTGTPCHLRVKTTYPNP